MLSPISNEENSEYSYNSSGDCLNGFKQNLLLSTSIKEDSIKNFDKTHLSICQNQEKEPFLNNSVHNNMISQKRACLDYNKRIKIFNIFKKNKLTNSEHEINCSIESDVESELDNLVSNSENEEKRVSANSKVNFSKLSDMEKDERLKNLAKLVKRLRRKTRNLEQRFKKNANKILNKYLSTSLGIKKYKTNNIPLNISVDSLSKALKILRNYDKFEYDDQCHVIENFINLIAEEKMPFDSINFRKICTQIRLFLTKEQSNYISKKGQKITFSFPEKDINITTKEYELYSKYKDQEDVIRTIIGIPEDNQNNIYPERINFENKKATQNFNTERNSNINPNETSNLMFTNKTNSANFRSNQNYNPSGIITNNVSNNLGNFRISNTNKDYNFNKYNINDIVNLGMISNNGNLQNLILNSMYSNLIQNFSSQNSAC